jgi:hypothetical protein
MPRVPRHRTQVWLFTLTRRWLPVSESLADSSRLKVARAETALPVGQLRGTIWAPAGVGTAHLVPLARLFLLP